MKSLQNKLYEGFYKNAGGMVCPTTREELEDEISIRLSRGQTNLNDIDTSKITDMSYLFFADKRDLRNLDISKWDTSNVTDMRSMFYECPNFNCDLSDWNVSKVKDIRCMFFNCHKFNSDLSRWNTSKVEYMIFAFDGSGVTSLPEWYRDNREE